MKKKRVQKAQPISEAAFRELEQKFGVPVAELRDMAERLNLGRPRLEVHLLVLQQEAKRKNKSVLIDPYIYAYSAAKRT